MLRMHCHGFRCKILEDCPRSKTGEIASTSISLGSLEDEVQRLLSKSLAKSTFASYQKSLEKFCVFRDTAGLENTWPSL